MPFTQRHPAATEAVEPDPDQQGWSIYVGDLRLRFKARKQPVRQEDSDNVTYQAVPRQRAQY